MPALNGMSANKCEHAHTLVFTVYPSIFGLQLCLIMQVGLIALSLVGYLEGAHCLRKIKDGDHVTWCLLHKWVSGKTLGTDCFYDIKDGVL